MTSANLSDLLSRGRKLKNAFDRLGSDHTPGGALISEIEAWLKECIDYGRFLSDPSPERRALQSRVDFWTSLLARNDYTLPDIDRIADFDPEAGSPLEVDFPYPGLAAYGENQQGLFCGREEDTDLYSAHLEQHPALLLVSESGGGKSSLAMAGILPKLKEAHPDWLFATRMTPGTQPIEALSSVLREALHKLPADFLQAAVDAGDAATRVRVAARLILDALDGRMLLIFVDQLEELLTLCNDAQQQADFSALLSALAERGNCRVLATMRSDHQHQLANSQACRPLFVLLAAKESVKTLAPLGFDQIRAAILKPAQAVGLRFVPLEIVDELARQTANLAGGLPLLQFALWRLWESRPTVDGRPLDFINNRQLQALPTVQEALGTAAEAQYKDLPPAGQAVCKRLMMELTIPAENYEDPMRRRRRESEVVRVLLKHGQAEVQEVEKLDEGHISELINRFVDARLLVRSGEGENKQIEVAHESIFRNWSTFRDWVSGEDAKARLQAIRLVAREAVQWADQGRAADYLKQKGEPLARALDYAKEGWLVDPVAMKYLEACRKEESKPINWKLINWKLIAYIVAAIVIVGVVIYTTRKTVERNERKDAALNSLPLLAPSLPPWEALDVAQAATRGREDFRYVLAHALERMDGIQLLGESKARNGSIYFEGQGTVVVQFETPQKLNVFRVCDTGEVEKSPAELSLKEHNSQNLILMKMGIGPPFPSPGSDRVIVMAFKQAGDGNGIDLVSFLLSWSGSSPCSSTSSTSFPTPTPFPTRSITEDASNVSDIAFDSEGRSAVFSVLRDRPEKPNQPPISTLWQLFWEEGNKNLKVKKLTVETDPESKEPDESVVTAVGFRKGNGHKTVDRLITGRLNGAIYCGSKRLESKDGGSSRVRQISSRPDSKNEDWFAYLQESGQLSAWRCKNGEPFTFPTSADPPSAAGLPFVNLNYLRDSPDGPEMPLVTYVDGKKLKCWKYTYDPESKKEGWQERACSSTHSVDRMTLSPDARHVITIEVSGVAAVHRFPLQFLTDREKKFVGRLADNKLILWNTGTTGNGKTTVWKGSEAEEGFERFEAESPLHSKIRGAALSPSGKQIVWVESGIQPNNGDPKYKVSRFETSTQNLNEVGEIDRSEDFIIAVDDSGRTAVGTNILKLFPPVKREHPSGGEQIEMGEKEDKDLIVCLGFSPDSNSLVVGTQAGKLWLRKDEGWSEPPMPQRDQTDRRPAVTACAVSNDGTIVGGFTDGSVWVFKSDQKSKSVRLSPKAIYQFTVPVKAVSLEEGQDKKPHHVAALWEWQASSCTRPGLPGHSVQIWDLQRVWNRGLGDEPPPVSTRCFPNQRVTTIGSVRPIKSEGKITDVRLPVVFGKEVQLIPCRGCAHGDETPKQMLERLKGEAQKLGAQVITDKQLETTYGIRF